MRTPTEALEAALKLLGDYQGTVIVSTSHLLTLRWANNAPTTSTDSHGDIITVQAVRDGKLGTVQATLAPELDLAALVQQAKIACDAQPVAGDAAELPVDFPDVNWTASPPSLDQDWLAGFASGLTEPLATCRRTGLNSIGFAYQQLRTVYLGNTRGVRRRGVQSTGTLEVTLRHPELGSVWTGDAATDIRSVSPQLVLDDLTARLSYGKRRISLTPERYDVILSPAAAADFMIMLYLAASRQAADEGRSAFSGPDGAGLIGHEVSNRLINLWSDPYHPGIEVNPFVDSTLRANVSGFDNGFRLEPTKWIDNGYLVALPTSQAWAERSGVRPQPFIDNLIMEVPGAVPEAQLLSGVKRALYITSLWYMRVTDPRTLNITGVTRDGVFLIEDGQIVGAANNFRFNDSPLDMLGRIMGAGPSQPVLARSYSGDFRRTAVPMLHIEGFNLTEATTAV